MSPYFETGDNEKIIAAKKLYRRNYKAAWRKANRKENKSYTVAWAKEELHSLTEAAKHHKQKPTTFIKKSCLAYINKRFITPNEREVTKALQLVAMTYNTIDSIAQENAIDTSAIKKIQEELFQLEHQMRITLLSPKTIEQILREEIQKHPGTKEYIKQFIETLQDGN
jgi:hypothetical protein